MHEDEILTDNTKIEYCRQCLACVFWGGNDPFSNQYNKACCRMYPYPDNKPAGVINNTERCEYRTEKK